MKSSGRKSDGIFLSVRTVKQRDTAGVKPYDFWESSETDGSFFTSCGLFFTCQ